MSIISTSVVIFLLCLVSLSTSSSSSRPVIGVIVKQELRQNTTFQYPMKNLKKLEEEEEARTININPSQAAINATKISDKRGMTLMNKKRKMRPNKQDQGHKLEHVINKHGRRQGHGTRRSHSKNIAKLPKLVSWRVPKSQDEVPQTGFNLDYAPPKVHPPTHN